MDVRRLLILTLGLVTVIVLAACSALQAGKSPTASASPAVSLPSAAIASPSTTPSPRNPSESSVVPLSSPTPLAGSAVNSAAQAAALVFESNPLFGSLKQQEAAGAGISSSYTAADSADGYAVTITMGSGDCPSSCINTHTWNYSVSRDGKIVLASEQGDPVEVSIDRGTADPATVTVRLVAGPVCPVEKSSPDPSCAPRPVPNVEVVLRDPSGKEVGRATADAGGQVTFSVPGGAYYAESAAAEGVMGQAEPEAFSVPGGRSITIALEYDTGIR